MIDSSFGLEVVAVFLTSSLVYDSVITSCNQDFDSKAIIINALFLENLSVSGEFQKQ